MNNEKCRQFKGGLCPHMQIWVDKRYCYKCRYLTQSGLTSIIIACRNEHLLNWTIDNVQRNAAGPIEFVIVLDGETVEQKYIGGYTFDAGVIAQENIKVIRLPEPVGRRKAINLAVEHAKGEYLLHIDAHCSMSQDWDSQLKAACSPNDLLVSVLRGMDENFKFTGGMEYKYCRITPECKTEWWLDYKRRAKGLLCETMSFTGCGWFLRTGYYKTLGGFDERFGQWGNNGSEWALKVWLNQKHPGRLIVHNGVTCGHVFRKKFPYKPQQKWSFTQAELKNMWSKDMPKLVEKFWPVPGWELPSLPTLGKNLAKATAKHIATGRKQRDQQEIAEILNRCRSNECGFYLNRNGNDRCRNRGCGCFLASKIKWQSEHCPLGKW